MGRIKKALALVLTGALCVGFSSCKPKPTAMQTTIFAMDTVMNLSFYGTAPQDHLEAIQKQMVDTLYEMQAAWDATDENSDVYRLNHAGGEPVEVSSIAEALLVQAKELCRITGGALDITAYPAVQAWGFTTGEYRVPQSAELEKVAGCIDYGKLEFDAAGVTLPGEMALDTGAVAKGYAGDWLGSILAGNGITSALLDLGQSSIMTIGTKPDGTPWRIGIQDPAGDSYLGVLELTDMAMGTSGNYQRYFEADGVRYCHIIDPATAAPVQNELESVTVVAPSCMTCDGLSTALFVMGLEEGTRFWRDHPELEFDVMFLDKTGAIFITPGLKDTFTLAEGYEDREVTVLS